jgi:hypothetical protein
VRILFLLSTILFVAEVSLALDLSTDATKDLRTGKEKSLSIKNNEEIKTSKGTKQSNTRSKGRDLSKSETIRTVGQAMQSGGLDVSLPLQNVFSAEIAALEQKGEGIFSSRIVTDPRLPKSFGLSAEVRPGLISLNKREYLDKYAVNNGDVSSVGDEEAIIAYIHQLAEYGAIIGQAYLNLSNDLAAIKGAVSREKDGTIKVKGIGYDDFVILAKGALWKAVQTGPINSAIKANFALLENIRPGVCQFDGFVTSIKCGPSVLRLGAIPQLRIAGQPWYGDGFAGFTGTYKLSSSWSYTDALEKMKSNASTTKFASEWTAYSEALESEGKSREAVMAKKKAWDYARSGRTNISPTRLLPNVQY